MAQVAYCRGHILLTLLKFGFSQHNLKETMSVQTHMMVVIQGEEVKKVDSYNYLRIQINKKQILISSSLSSSGHFLPNSLKVFLRYRVQDNGMDRRTDSPETKCLHPAIAEAAMRLGPIQTSKPKQSPCALLLNRPTKLYPQQGWCKCRSKWRYEEITVKTLIWLYLQKHFHKKLHYSNISASLSRTPIKPRMINQLHHLQIIPKSQLIHIKSSCTGEIF